MKQPLDRRRRAIAGLPPPQDALRGTVFVRQMRCGKLGCRCAQGDLHEATYLSVTLAEGRTEQISLPPLWSLWPGAGSPITMRGGTRWRKPRPSTARSSSSGERSCPREFPRRSGDVHVAARGREEPMEIRSALLAVGEGERADCFEAFSLSLDPAWIDQALAATGTATLRLRKLPAEQVVWLLIAMALFRDRSIQEAVQHLSLVLPPPGVPAGRAAVTAGGVVQARERLGPPPPPTCHEPRLRARCRTRATPHPELRHPRQPR